MSDDEAPPSKLALLSDTGLASAAEDGALDPREIVARVFERPFVEEQSIVLDVPAPPVGSTKPANIDIRRHRVAVAGKVNPDLLLAIVANLIATSSSAAVAVERIRDEVAGWTFARGPRCACDPDLYAATSPDGARRWVCTHCGNPR